MKHIKFNLNDHIKVKLHDRGYDLLANNHNAFAAYLPDWEIRTAEYYKSRADADGYTRFQAWCFIEQFKDTFDLGICGFYDNDILIEIEKTESK